MDIWVLKRAVKINQSGYTTPESSTDTSINIPEQVLQAFFHSLSLSLPSPNPSQFFLLGSCSRFLVTFLYLNAKNMLRVAMHLGHYAVWPGELSHHLYHYHHHHHRHHNHPLLVTRVLNKSPQLVKFTGYFTWTHHLLFCGNYPPKSQNLMMSAFCSSTQIFAPECWKCTLRGPDFKTFLRGKPLDPPGTL